MKLFSRKAAFLMILVLLPSAATAQKVKHKVVFALTSSDSADWNLTLGNIRNLISEVPTDSVQVEVVAYGPGLSFVRANSSSQDAIQKLESRHVKFLACENSMKMQHVTRDDLVPGVATVPSGVVEVVTKEEQGWSYIKAGR